MPSSSIRVDNEFRSRREVVRGAVDRALPHRSSYLGFILGLFATVIIAMAAFAWWAVHSGLVYVQINM